MREPKPSKAYARSSAFKTPSPLSPTTWGPPRKGWRLSKSNGTAGQNVGDVDGALSRAATKIEATYQVPFLAHATMEPMNCTVHIQKDRCEIWVGTQVIARAQAAAAKTAGLPLENVTVHNHLIGGGFGRRLEVDGIIRAVQVAQHVDGPVK